MVFAVDRMDSLRWRPRGRDAASLAIMQANKGAQRNLGFTQAELEGMSVRELTPQFSEAQLRKLL